MSSKSYEKLNLTLVYNLKRKIEELKKSEENYKGLFDNAVDAIFVANTITRQVVDCNKSAEKLMGYSRDKILSMKADDLHSKESRKKTMEGFKKQAEGKIKSIFSEVLTKDNKRIPIEISASGINIGNERYIQAIFRDISERKKAEEALKQSEEKFRTLLENLPQKIFLKDKNLVYLSCNKHYADDLKIKPDEIKGKTDYKFYPKKLAKKYRKDDKKIMKAGKTGDIEEEYIKDGQKLFVHTVKTPVKDEKGKVIGILGIFWDITKQKKTEDALKESEEKFSKLFIASPDMITLTRISDGFFVDASDSAQRILGYKREELLGHTIKELRLWPKPEERELLVQNIKKEGSVRNMEISLRKKSGEIFPAKISVDMLKLKGGQFMISVAHDITEQKKAEEKFKQQKEKYKKEISELKKKPKKR